MKNTKEVRNSLFIISLFLLMACGRKQLSPQEFISWVEDGENGLSVEKNFDDVDFQVLYKPSEYVAAKELANGGISKQDVLHRLEELKGMQYFTLRIKSVDSKELLSANIRDEQEYEQRLEYFMDAIQTDIRLIEGKDTLPCALSHYERTYGLAPYNNFVIAFAKSSGKEPRDKVFMFNDKLLGTGKVMFKIEADDLKNIPEVIWK